MNMMETYNMLCKEFVAGVDKLIQTNGVLNKYDYNVYVDMFYRDYCHSLNELSNTLLAIFYENYVLEWLTLAA